ncbi:hypothetical protein G7Y82_17515 [Solimonas sp. C16B3]|uniref:Uncharacterized protein n=1 Tax=Solimonas marina TaxID=2714601 RepID=A0A970BA80_9GAMM|nr:hypothetical protein [Solimonas marina]
MRVLAVIVAALFVSACADRRTVATVEKPSIPQSEAECDARGGNWTTLGIAYPGKPKVCDLKTTDAGNVCSDSSECQGSCRAPEHVAVGLEASGTCSAYASNFGNILVVEHGSVRSLTVE